jgi:hypothetical protein
MSATRKVVPIYRALQVASYTWASGTLTVNTVAAHGLVTGNYFEFADSNFPQVISGTITVTSTTQFTMSVTTGTQVNALKMPGTVYTNIYNTGATGAQDTFTWGWNQSPSGAVQINTNSTGTVTVKVEGSLDGVNWVDMSTAEVIGTSGTFIFTITNPYVYGRLNFTAAVAGTGGQVAAFKAVV